MEGFLAPPKRTVAHKIFINFQCTAMMVDKNQDEERKKMKNQNEIRGKTRIHTTKLNILQFCRAYPVACDFYGRTSSRFTGVSKQYAEG